MPESSDIIIDKNQTGLCDQCCNKSSAKQIRLNELRNIEKCNSPTILGLPKKLRRRLLLKKYNIKLNGELNDR